MTRAQLPALRKLAGDRLYRLNWLKGCRWNKGRLEINACFVPEDARASGPLEIWFRASDFPLLILGSRWYRGIMVGKPLGLRHLILKSARMVQVRGVTPIPDGKKLSLAPSYPLADARGNMPVLEFEGFEEGDEEGPAYRIYLPLSEAYRSHYFNIQVALASITGGLINGALTNPAFMAWDPNGTHWINQSAGEARITPAEGLPHELTKRLARILFSSNGIGSLKEIHRWIQKSFAAPDPAAKSASQAWLPIVKLPYPYARWDASVVPLPVDEDGRHQLLVLHLESFDAPEPFNELEIMAAPARHNEGDEEEAGGRGGILLDPDSEDPIDDVDQGWDPALEPVALEDVISRDETALRRAARIVRPEPREGSAGGRGGRRTVPVSEGSTQPMGNSGSGVAPLVFTSDDTSSKRADSLDSSFVAIRRAGAAFVERHRSLGIVANARFLPCDARVYAFRVPASNTERAKAVAVARQYLIAEISTQGRYAYVIEPERRCESQPLPLGIVWRKVSHDSTRAAVFATDNLHEIVRMLENAARAGHSWIGSVNGSEHYAVKPVIHASGAPPNDKALERFSQRILLRMLEVLGDARVVAQT